MGVGERRGGRRGGRARAHARANRHRRNRNRRRNHHHHRNGRVAFGIGMFGARNRHRGVHHTGGASSGGVAMPADQCLVFRRIGMIIGFTIFTVGAILMAVGGSGDDSMRVVGIILMVVGIVTFTILLVWRLCVLHTPPPADPVNQDVEAGVATAAGGAEINAQATPIPGGGTPTTYIITTGPGQPGGVAMGMTNFGAYSPHQPPVPAGYPSPSGPYGAHNPPAPGFPGTQYPPPAGGMPVPGPAAPYPAAPNPTGATPYPQPGATPITYGAAPLGTGGVDDGIVTAEEPPPPSYSDVMAGQVDAPKVAVTEPQDGTDSASERNEP